MITTRDGDPLDGILRTIEFPGEDPRAIQGFLSTAGLADAVMQRVVVQAFGRKALAWAGFVVADLAILSILGTSDAVRESFFGVQESLARFFFGFLGVAAIGGIVGFVFSIDTSWFSRWTRRHSW